MRLYRVSLLAFNLSLLIPGQQGNAPRLGSDAPPWTTKEVPEWPAAVTQVRSLMPARFS